MQSAFDLAASMPWAMPEPWLRTILEIAARENPSIEQVEAQLGRPLDNTKNVTYRSGVAIIPVSGPIFRRANMFTEISGATSIEILARDFQAALSDPQVKSIVLEFDSPGGEITGVSEFADMIYNSSKPVTAYVDGMAASAGYFLASAAQGGVVINDMALLGSIGTVIAVPDPNKRTSKDIEIVSSQSPYKRPNAATEGGRAQLQDLVDSLTEVFIGKVAQYRGESPDKVRSEFGQGKLFVGQEAVDAGLADRTGSLEGVIAEFRSATANNWGNKKMTMGGRSVTVSVGEEEIASGPVGSKVTLSTEAESHASSLINSGKVDRTSSWSYSAADEDKCLGDPPNWGEYGKWFLGRVPGADTKTKGAYKYPTGKNGKVYRSGVIAAKQRAAQQGDKPIEDAAARLLDKIDHTTTKPIKKQSNGDDMKNKGNTIHITLDEAENAPAEVEQEVAPRAEESPSVVAKMILENEKLRADNDKLKSEFLQARADKIKAEVEKYVAAQTTSMLFNRDQGAIFGRLLTHAMIESNTELEKDLRAFVAATPKIIPTDSTKPAAAVEEVTSTSTPTKEDFDHKTDEGDARINNAAKRIEWEKKIPYAKALMEVRESVLKG